MRLSPFGRALYAVGGRYALVGVLFVGLPVFWWNEGVPAGTRAWRMGLRELWNMEGQS